MFLEVVWQEHLHTERVESVYIGNVFPEAADVLARAALGQRRRDRLEPESVSVLRMSSDDGFYDLLDGQFNIPGLGQVVPDHAVMEGFEVEVMFSGLGQRTLILNARKGFLSRKRPSNPFIEV